MSYSCPNVRIQDITVKRKMSKFTHSLKSNYKRVARHYDKIHRLKFIYACKIDFELFKKELIIARYYIFTYPLCKCSYNHLI